MTTVFQLKKKKKESGFSGELFISHSVTFVPYLLEQCLAHRVGTQKGFLFNKLTDGYTIHSSPNQYDEGTDCYYLQVFLKEISITFSGPPLLS